MNELEIFSNALEIASADERSQYLDQACGDDVELRKRIDDLLRSHSDVGSFMVALAPGIGASIDEPITEKPGTAIGPYKLLQQIGEGGFGVVYMAEQMHPVRRIVALMII